MMPLFLITMILLLLTRFFVKLFRFRYFHSRADKSKFKLNFATADKESGNTERLSKSSQGTYLPYNAKYIWN